ncbi:hypothetical protein BSFP_068760 [Burkholderia stabilis]|uniref:Uncharacterized protein n=1 Tax=Burkholderia stabilis TaxID=95485 RepID=A0A1Y1BVG3_9BURK|nr:hypothetical protein BSFP_068760 [Burkholderia stabilis]
MTGGLRRTGAGIRATTGPTRRGRVAMVALVVMLVTVLPRALVIMSTVRILLVVLIHGLFP